MRLQPGLGPLSVSRTIWSSSRARDQWKPRLDRIFYAVDSAERQSVVEGIREACYQPLRHVQYLELLPWALKHGLFVRILRTAKAFQGFAHRYEPGDDFLVTVFARSEEALDSWEEALGYPKCCQEFFHREWPLIVDPIWQWAGAPTDQAEVSVSPSVYTVPVLRYLSVRFVPHLACNPWCEKSIELGRAFRSLMPTDVVDWLEELLTQPLTWDCYRGAAIVTSPLFRVVVGSVPTAIPYRVFCHASV